MDNNLQAPRAQAFSDSEQFRHGNRTVSLFCGIFRHDACLGECFCACHLSQTAKVRGSRPNIVTLAFELRAVAKNLPDYWTESDVDEHLSELVARACNSRMGYGNDPCFFPINMSEWARTPVEAYRRIRPTVRRNVSNFESTLADIFGKTPTTEELEKAFKEDLREIYAEGLIDIH